MLACFGKRIEHLGPVGAGHAMKAINNALLAVNILTFGEGFAGLARSRGAGPEGCSTCSTPPPAARSSPRGWCRTGCSPARSPTPSGWRCWRRTSGSRWSSWRVRGSHAPVLHLAAQLFRAARASSARGRRLPGGDPAQERDSRGRDQGIMTDWAATNRIAARVTLAEGLVIQGEVHLQPRVAWRDGPETPAGAAESRGCLLPHEPAAGRRRVRGQGPGGRARLPEVRRRSTIRSGRPRPGRSRWRS